MIRNVKALTASSYLSMFFLGFTSTVVGAAARNIGLSPTQIGLMLAIQNLGFILAVIACGALADTHEKPRVLMVGSFILAVSLLMFSFHNDNLFGLSLLAMLLLGIGAGSYEGITDAMLVDLHPGNETFHISINHFFVTFGAIMITVYMIFLQMKWRNAILQSAAVIVLLAVFFALARLKRRGDGGISYRERLKILGSERAVVVLFICVILAVGIEISTIGILTSYLMELRDFTQVTSKIGLLVFLGGMLTGRLLVGFFARQDRLLHYILLLMGSGFIFSTVLYFVPLGDAIYVALFLTGFSASAVLPLLISLSGLRFKDLAGTVIGVIKVAIPIGGMLIPFLISVLSDAFSFQAALLVLPVSFLLAFLLVFVSRSHLQLSQ